MFSFIEKFRQTKGLTKIEKVTPMSENLPIDEVAKTPIIVEDKESESSIIVPEEETNSEQEQLSDDRFEKLATQISSLVKHYDALAETTNDDNAKAIMSDISSHLISSLVLGGCEPIVEDGTYDIARHISVPMSMAVNGAAIQSFIRIGVSLNGNVLIPALVEICEQKFIYCPGCGKKLLSSDIFCPDCGVILNE